MLRVSEVVGAFAAMLALVAGANAADSSRLPDYRRGAQLHDDACTGCHGPSMYSRPYHERNPYFTVRKQVEIWQDFVGMGWDEQQIADVAHYVQKRFYEKACEQGGC